MSKEVLVQLRLPPNLARRVRAHCRKLNTPVAGWVRHLIDERLGEVAHLRDEVLLLQARLRRKEGE